MLEKMVRIIGGKWRGRKITVSQEPAVRPTPDRVRETLFNWLAPYVDGASCLDAFAGSGALGFEALSRGAAAVTFVDAEKKVVEQLRQTAVRLEVEADKVTIVQSQFPRKLHSNTQFDIVFLDPPFTKNLVVPCVHFLQKNKMLKEKALIYIETEVALQNLRLPSDWKQLKYKKAGKVSYRLYSTTA